MCVIPGMLNNLLLHYHAFPTCAKFQCLKKKNKGNQFSQGKWEGKEKIKIQMFHTASEILVTFDVSAISQLFLYRVMYNFSRGGLSRLTELTWKYCSLRL